MRRAPIGPLAAFVSSLWTSDSASGATAIERVVPTGTMHLVVRLSPDPLIVYEDERGCGGREIGRAVIGGARSSFYVRDVSRRSRAVGALLRPGAARALFGAPASVFAEMHTSLDDVWGAEAERVRDEIGSEPTLSGALTRFEAILTRRVLDAPTLSPLAASAVRRVAVGEQIGSIVRESGRSHRHLIASFQAAVGLSPKTFARVMRADRAIAMLAMRRPIIEVAAAAGYADQAHCTRELVEIAGVTPAAFRRLDAPSRHLPIAPMQFRSRRSMGPAT